MSEQTTIEPAGESRLDGWQNEVIGIGGAKDPSVYTTFVGRGSGLTDATLEALYVEEHFAAKIVECVVEHGMRKGWDLILPGDPRAAAEARARYEADERRLGVVEEMFQGATWGRLFGGAVTWVGVNDGKSPDNPLDEAAIKSVDSLHTFDRRDVVIHTRYQDPSHPKFQKPESYRIFPRTVGAVGSLSGFFGTAARAGGTVVHESRLVVWPGEGTTDQRKLERSGWDDSVLERCWGALKQTGEDYSHKSQLLSRIAQMVMKVKGFGGIVAAKEATFRARLALINLARSLYSIMPIDIDESVENVTQPTSGAEGLIDKSVERLAIAADIPLTVFVGRPPTGASGESELESWNVNVETWQQHVLLPRHRRIAQLILLAKNGPVSGKLDPGWRIQYRALRTPKPKELAELRKLNAEADAIEIDKGIVNAEDVAVARHSLTGTGEVILTDETLQAKRKRREAQENQPPKDNAELGTVGARSESVIGIIEAIVNGRIPRESGETLLVELHRYTPEVAKKLLGPDGFKPTPKEEPGKPGPAPAPKKGEGAGAPQGLPGFNDGGDPAKKTLPPQGGA